MKTVTTNASNKKPLTIFCDDNVCVGAAILVNMIHRFLHAVHHLQTTLQVAVLCAQGLDLRWTERQVRN